MIQLGMKVRDTITGFEGTTTGRHDYISGCVQWSVTPPLDKDGKMGEVQHFDEQRLVQVGAEVVKLDNAKTPGGPQRDMPPSR